MANKSFLNKQFRSLELLEPRLLLTVIPVTNTLSSGDGSLLAAIEEANSNDEPDEIVFNIIPSIDTEYVDIDSSLPGGDAEPDVFVIRPTTALELFSLTEDGTTINGHSQSTFNITDVNSNPFGPEIVIDGSHLDLGVVADGMFVDASNSQILGLNIQGFSRYGVVVQSGADTTIAGNYIGTNATGAEQRPNAASGVLIVSSNNVVGGTTALDRNVISGNTGSGILVKSENLPNVVSGNTIQGNYIGTNALGTSELPNGLDQSNGVGVGIINASNNLIGGTESAAKNLISGNKSVGVLLDGSFSNSNRVEGNYIGIDALGSNSVPNDRGVVISNSASDNTIGGATLGTGNVVSGNNGNGIEIRGASNKVLGNLIGLNIDKSQKLSNANGIHLENAKGTEIGGSSPTLGNVISGNRQNGILMNGPDVIESVVRGNLIGTTEADSASLGNEVHGLLLVNASNNTIGGPTIADGNVISGNANGSGVFINATSGGHNNLIESNRIGTDADGTTAVSNSHGVMLFNGYDNIIRGNLISGNTGTGIILQSEVVDGALNSANNNHVLSNLIGTDASGTSAIGNTTGVIITNRAHDNKIGAEDLGNIVSGNLSDGIRITSDSNFVQGNSIGMDSTGETAIPNGGSGVVVTNGSLNLIGGATTGARNIISGNGANGVFVEGVLAQANAIQGNYIGLSADGSRIVRDLAADQENKLRSSAGIRLNGAVGTRIGGSGPGEGNVISGNHRGIDLGPKGQVGATATRIEGNLIGTDANGQFALGNAFDGVAIVQASGNTVGGPDPSSRNVISGNQTGIYVSEGSENAVLGNLIGTDETGAIAIGNSTGIYIWNAERTQVGGLGAGNVISGNYGNGIYLLQNSGGGNQIVENLIGVSRSGDIAIGNGEHGINLQDSPNNIVRSNVISANENSAVQLMGEGTFNTTVTKNFIGTDVEAAISNLNAIDYVSYANGVGISINGAIYNEVTDNLISYHLLPGIYNERGIGNTYRKNRFFSLDGQQPIDLGADGRTRNDLSDLDTGANGLQNFPGDLGVIVTNSDTERFTTSLGLGTQAIFPVTLDFYRSDSNGNTVSEWLGAFEVTAATGVIADLVQDMNLPGISSGDYIVATATDGAGNTSEVSGAAKVSRIGSPDRLEPDDSIANAIKVNLSSQQISHSFPDRSIHDFDDTDFFEIRVLQPEGQQLSAGTLVVELDDSEALGALDLQASDLAGNEIIRSSNQSGTERFAFPILAHQLISVDGQFEFHAIIKVAGFSGVNPYSINFTLDVSDEDADGITDSWEECGYVMITEACDDIPVDRRIPLRAASPDTKDVYVEVDYAAGRRPEDLDEALMTTIEQQFPKVAPLVNDVREGKLQDAGLSRTGTILDLVVASFLRAPVDNLRPEKTGVRLHLVLDDAEAIPAEKGQLQSWNEFLDIREDYFGTNAEKIDRGWWNSEGTLAKRNAYRYAFFGTELVGSQARGRATVGSNDFVITLGDSGEDRGRYALNQAAVFMHELGHTFGLDHGGGDDVNFKPNYISIMNYAWTFPELLLSDEKSWALDYSRYELPEIDRRNLDSNTGIACVDDFLRGHPNGDVEAFRSTYDQVNVPIGPPPLGANAKFQTVLASECNPDWRLAPGSTERDLGRLVADSNGDFKVDEQDQFYGDDSYHGYDDWSNLQFHYTYTNVVSKGDADDYGGGVEPFRQPVDIADETNDEPEAATVAGEVWDLIKSLVSPFVRTQAIAPSPSENQDIDWFRISSDFPGTIEVTVRANSNQNDYGFDVCVFTDQGAIPEGPCDTPEIIIAGDIVDTHKFSVATRNDNNDKTTNYVSVTSEFDSGEYDFTIRFQPFGAGVVDFFAGSALSSRDVAKYDLNRDELLDEQDLVALLEEGFDSQWGDVNVDGKVDDIDYDRILANFGKVGGWTAGDLNLDHQVDLNDIARLRLEAHDILFCDFDGDSVCSDLDIDLISAAIRSTDQRYKPIFDSDLNGALTENDRLQLLHPEPGFKEVLEGDVNLDCKVDFSDFLLLSANFGKAGGWASGDTNGNGDVDFGDFLKLSAAFGNQSTCDEKWTSSKEK